MEVAEKRKPGRPKLPIEKRMEFLSVQIPPEVRTELNLLSIRCDKSTDSSKLADTPYNP